MDFGGYTRNFTLCFYKVYDNIKTYIIKESVQMKKIMLLTLISLMIPTPMIHAQESNLDERVSQLETKMDKILELLGGQDETNNENESEVDIPSENEIRRIEDIPTGLDEGFKYNVNKTGSSFDFITIANVRYNDEYLLLDVEFKSKGGVSNIVDRLKYTYKIEQYSDETSNSDTPKGEPLLIQFYQLPKELIGDLDILPVDAEMDGESSSRYTIAYKLAMPIEAGSKVIMDFGGNQKLEFDLKSSNTVI